MDFNKYKVIKKAVSYELANFCYNYFLLKRDAINFMYQHNILPNNPLHGTWEDHQVPGAYSIYGDPVMDTLLVKVLPVMKEKTGLDLVPTYSYARVYEEGHELKRHKDRPSCEISTTLNLGGDLWPIYLEPSGEPNKEGIRIDLEPGDMLIYSGCDLEHWREPFKGKMCGQVFLHYNHINGPFAKENLYDKRPMLGMPSFTKQR
tara:strand:+ start:2167 stop:2778 length:612 start_codon:yes stop_codon:yes gene_type:complete